QLFHAFVVVWRVEVGGWPVRQGVALRLRLRRTDDGYSPPNSPVRPPRRWGLAPSAEPAGRPAPAPPEQAFEQVADVGVRAEPFEVAGREAAAPPAARALAKAAETATRAAEGHRRIPVGADFAAVEARPFVFVREQVVGIRDIG